MKNTRHEKILQLIEQYEIDTQQALVDRLCEAGYHVTQTTVSRDIRVLKLVKGMTARGTYKYVLPDKVKENAPVLGAAITDSVVSIVEAQNLILVKTHAGMANAVAVCIDNLDHKEMLGSVAGDDTILIVTKDNENAAALSSRMKEAFKK